MPPDTSNTLRRAMKLLGYTNQSLADELSQARTDGLRTSPATVSRWVSGAQAMEPALALYFKERLAGLLFESYKPRFSAAKFIGIGGAKGGSGSSTIAMALAVAASDLGYRVALYTYNESCNNGYFRNHDVHHVAMPEPESEIELENFDFVFADLPSRMFSVPTLPPDLVSKFLCQLDLLIVPADIGYSPEANSATVGFRFLESLPYCPPWRILHTTRSFQYPWLFECMQDLQPWIRLLMPSPLIYHTEPLEYQDLGFKWRFISDDGAMKFHQLLQQICEEIGVSLHERPHSLHELRRQSMSELVDQLAY